MLDALVTHPDSVQLTRFGQGRLTTADSAEIESHLASCETCREALEFVPPDPFIALLRAAADPAVRPSLSLRFGYEILAELGRGGMGVVYKARQAGLNRFVALKMIRHGPDAGPAAIARFRREAEAVARLHHPNVVQVYEVGEQGGEPYLSLELVEGPSLSEKLAAGPLPPKSAAELVEILARAIAHAHARGIVHRDLKPANVLLETRDAERGAPNGKSSASSWVLNSAFYTPKITDFGLAKHLYAAGHGPTETGAVLGSPCYMAPEQAAGQPERVGPATDVYALGAILYECLTGRPPLQGPTALETLRQVADNEPVTVRQLQPAVPPDLETICHTCLRKEAASRYSSAEALADDLARFLRGEPVRARPVGRAKRAWKWIQRKPTAAALIALVAIIPPIAGVAVAIHVAQLREEVQRAKDAAEESSRQQQRADRNYRMARDALGRMLDQLQAGDFAALPRLTELRAKQAETALAFFEQAADDADDPDPAVRLDVACAYDRAGELALTLGRGSAARNYFLRAKELLDGLAAISGGPDSRAERANCLCRLGYSYSGAGEAHAREDYQRQALALYEELALEKGVGPSPGVAWVNHALGHTCLNAKRWDEAETHFRRSADLRRELVHQSSGTDAPDRIGAADSLVNLILVYGWKQKPEQARAAFHEVEELLLPLLNDPSQKTKAAIDLASASQNLADLLNRQGKAAEAVDLCESGIKLAEPVLRREPELAAARTAVFNLHGTRGLANLGLERYREAAADYDTVVELCDPAARDQHRVTRAALLAAAGDVHRAAAEADDLLARAKLNDLERFNLACTFGLAARAESGTTLTHSSAERAIKLLQGLHGNGFFEKSEYADLLRHSSEFDSLRARPDFKQLLQGL